MQIVKRMPLLRDASTRRYLKGMPVIRQVRRAIRKTRNAYYRHLGGYQLRKALAATPTRRVVIGAWDRYDSGWIPTQREFLNLVKAEDWERFFQPDSIDAILAEHVWEHLTLEDSRVAARACFKYLRPGGYLRVAVPDGLLPDPTYVELVKADSPIPNDHKVLYTYRTLSDVFEKAGFQVKLYEYFDEGGVFHDLGWDQSRGTISRSRRFDPRNRGGQLASVYPGSLDDYMAYSSIVLDAIKE